MKIAKNKNMQWFKTISFLKILTVYSLCVPSTYLAMLSRNTTLKTAQLQDALPLQSQSAETALLSNQHSKNCFILKDLVVQPKDTVLKGEGNSGMRYAPCSSFKIVLALMGYDSGLLKDENHPIWVFKKGYADFLDSWKTDQTPTSWMKKSCVWYSQVLTQKLGMKKFQNYMDKIQYGNMDLSGDKGKNNGLTSSWLSSSLTISPAEQCAFLEKLLKNALPFSIHAHKMTRQILFIENLPQGWKLYGKTGSGKILDQNNEKTNIQHGWFLGWIEKDSRKIIFVHHVVDQKPQETFAGPRAKEEAKEKLLQVIEKLRSY